MNYLNYYEKTVFIANALKRHTVVRSHYRRHGHVHLYCVHLYLDITCDAFTFVFAMTNETNERQEKNINALLLKTNK